MAAVTEPGVVTEFISKFGFPIVAAVWGGYMIYFVWAWATKEAKPLLSEVEDTMVALIDRVRMLDNDLIRLNQKISIILQLRRKKIKQENDNHE